jgi:hypothetical protein
MTNENLPTAPVKKKKDGFAYRALLKIAAVVGIGWAVMLVIVRVLGIILGLIAAPIVGFTVLILFPEASTLFHTLAFVLPPFIVWGAAELFIWYYNSPIDAWIHS